MLTSFRQGLYRERKNGFRKDHYIRPAHTPKTCCRSLRDICTSSDTHSVSSLCLLGAHVLLFTVACRELAFQISEQFAVLGAALNIRTSVIVGGMDMMAQSLELGNRPHVVIATPGRLVDHLNSGSGEWNLSRVKFLV